MTMDTQKTNNAQRARRSDVRTNITNDSTTNYCDKRGYHDNSIIHNHEFQHYQQHPQLYDTRSQNMVPFNGLNISPTSTVFTEEGEIFDQLSVFSFDTEYGSYDAREDEKRTTQPKKIPSAAKDTAIFSHHRQLVRPTPLSDTQKLQYWGQRKEIAHSFRTFSSNFQPPANNYHGLQEEKKVEKWSEVEDNDDMMFDMDI
jgi:hypothetical protein